MKIHIPLILLAMLTSLHASTPFEDPEEFSRHQQVARSFQALVFRNIPPNKLTKERKEFLNWYPQTSELEDSSIFYDRGFSKFHNDPFFIAASIAMAQAADQTPGGKLTVYDCGSGDGTVAVLLASLGLHTVAIEAYCATKDAETFQRNCDYVYKLSQKLGHKGFSCLFRGRDILQHVLSDSQNFPKNSGDFALCGNFFHMFTPPQAKFITTEVFGKILKEGAVVWASVDDITALFQGSSHVESVHKVYEKSKADKKPFPSLLTFNTLCAYKGERILENLYMFYTPANVTSEFTTQPLCRLRKQFQLEWTIDVPFFNVKAGEIIPRIFLIQKTLCPYDRELIDFIFPKDMWDSHVETNQKQWSIIAQKKQ